MEEETDIITFEEASPVNQPAVDVDSLLLAGDTLSRSMLFALRRDYLDEPVFEQKMVRLLDEKPIRLQEVAFLELEQVGKTESQDLNENFKAIQTTLAACHDLRYQLVFLISSDGLKNRIFIGVSTQEPDSQPKIFAKQLGQFLCSNWPGTRVSSITDYKHIVDHIHVPLSSYRYARAFTGIPSPKSSGKPDAYPQSLDRLMRGLRGTPYIYMVVADPVPEKNVGEIVTTCQTLASQVHAFTRSTIQRSKSSGVTETSSSTKGDTITKGTADNTTVSQSESRSKGVLGTTLEKSSPAGKGAKAVGVAAISGLSLFAGGPFLLSGILGMFSQLLPSSGSSETTGTGRSESESISRSNSLSTGTSQASGESLSYGQEYLNKHAEACINCLKKQPIVLKKPELKVVGMWESTWSVIMLNRSPRLRHNSKPW